MSKSKDDRGEVRIYGVPDATVQAIQNISDNLGVTASSFLKPHIKSIVDSQPDSLKRPREKDKA